MEIIDRIRLQMSSSVEYNCALPLEASLYELQAVTAYSLKRKGGGRGWLLPSPYGRLTYRIPVI